MRSEEPDISREHSTNDRMLRCDRIDAHFFVDTLFATRKPTKLTRGSTCCQLFVTDKSFVHVEPLRKRRDLIYAVNSFAKEFGVPEAIIVDGTLG